MNVTANPQPVGSIAYVGADPSAGRSSLGAEDFMKLLTTQLATQDPMEPMKDTEFIAQMANFTSLEQMRALSASFASFAESQTMALSPLYLGREVTVVDVNAESGETTGTVEAIELKDGVPVVIIDGKSYETSLITRIGSTK